jgi:hypothetical protein
MSQRITVYSMLGVMAAVDGLRVVGMFDGDDAITVESREDEGDWLIGADGSALFSQTADASAQITLKLQHTSPTHQQLLNKMAQQRSGALIPFPFDVTDVNGGEGSHSGNCLVMKAPSQQYGENATVREWVLASPSWQPV